MDDLPIPTLLQTCLIIIAISSCRVCQEAERVNYHLGEIEEQLDRMGKFCTYPETRVPGP